MHKKFKWGLFMLVVLIGSAFSLKSRPKGLKYLPDYFVYIPAGKVLIPTALPDAYDTDSCEAFYISNREVSNRDYREFVYWMKQNRPEQWQEMLPDTTVWRSSRAYHEPYVKFYFQHPAYLDYPVVGISKSQAEAYCEWLTEIYIPKKDGVKPHFMLPSRKQWIRAARGAGYQPYPHKGSGLRNGKGQFLYNFKAMGDQAIYFDSTIKSYRVMSTSLSLVDGGLITTECHSYWPNEFGLYNMSGNVAEMVADASLALGGSWNDAGYDIRIDRMQSAQEASATIGFRIMALLPEDMDH